MDQHGEAHRKLKVAQELMRQLKHSEAIKEMKEALAIAQANGEPEQEVEILVALALVLSGRGLDSDNRQHYFTLAEKKIGNVKSSAVKMIYLRARAAIFEENGDLAGAEGTYQEALEFCRTEPDDEKNNLAMQGCVLRASLVHFLCNANRSNEALPLSAESEQYAREHRDAEDGELLQAALEAGIHLSIASGDEQGAVERITELEHAASTPRKADRIGGDLMIIANRAAHQNSYQTARAAADACVRLARRRVEPAPGFLVSALLTEARVILGSGDYDTALKKAEAILDFCNSPEDTIIRQAVQHLIAEIKQCSTDSQVAVDLTRQARSPKIPLQSRHSRAP